MVKINTAFFALFLSIVVGGINTAHAQARQLPQTTLQAGSHKITVEIAADDATRSYGLMYRQSLPDNHGMLFIFDRLEQPCFWMKNTPLPLSIAFIQPDGTIVNTADMAPKTTDTHCAAKPILYALEMEQGWFHQHGIKSGSKIQGLPRATTP